MAHPDIDQRRQAISKILSSGVEIKKAECRVISILYNCSESSVAHDARLLRAKDLTSSPLIGSGITDDPNNLKR